ncbi:hypothetical protein JKP88DRAFT_251795 [Tribonema minus]|uniref:Uncharacterized protein n=1 Tax=Tribonema minus TaxID=303371 RepID=A0A835ZFA6_9STRA|nr:hypothetical protein JKP88DRAFT_251795 [Tribonema minus]
MEDDDEDFAYPPPPPPPGPPPPRRRRSKSQVDVSMSAHGRGTSVDSLPSSSKLCDADRRQARRARHMNIAVQPARAAAASVVQAAAQEAVAAVTVAAAKARAVEETQMASIRAELQSEAKRLQEERQRLKEEAAQVAGAKEAQRFAHKTSVCNFNLITKRDSTPATLPLQALQTDKDAFEAWAAKERAELQQQRDALQEREVELHRMHTLRMEQMVDMAVRLQVRTEAVRARCHSAWLSNSLAAACGHCALTPSPAGRVYAASAEQRADGSEHAAPRCRRRRCRRGAQRGPAAERAELRRATPALSQHGCAASGPCACGHCRAYGDAAAAAPTAPHMYMDTVDTAAGAPAAGAFHYGAAAFQGCGSGGGGCAISVMRGEPMRRSELGLGVAARRNSLIAANQLAAAASVAAATAAAAKGRQATLAVAAVQRRAWRPCSAST